MKSIYVLLILIILQDSAIAQTCLTALYEHEQGSFKSITRNLIYLHAVNNSVSYTALIKLNSTKQKYLLGV